MHTVLKWLKMKRIYMLLVPLIFSTAANGFCGAFPLSDAAQALIVPDTSPYCAPFKVLGISGVPSGNADITVVAIPGATDYGFIDGYGDAGAMSASMNTADTVATYTMAMNKSMAGYDIENGIPIQFFAVAHTNSAEHPMCTAAYTVKFTKSAKKSKPPQDGTPAATEDVATADVPKEDICKPFKFLSVVPYGPARIMWTPFTHDASNIGDTYQYMYNVIVEATATDQTNIPLVNEWVLEPAGQPQVPSMKAAYDYSLPGNKRIYSYTVTVIGGFAPSDYPQNLRNPGYPYSKFCTISTTLLVLPTPTPIPPTSVPASEPAPASSNRPPSNPRPQPQPQVTPCPSGTTGDPANGVPCMKVPH